MDFDELLARLESAESQDEDADEGEGEGAEGDASQPWAAKLRELEVKNAQLAQQREDDRYTYLAQLAELKGSMGALNQPKAPAPQPKGGDVDLQEAMKLLPQHPEILPELLERLVEERLGSVRSSIKDEITSDMGRRTADQRLRGIINENYADDIKPGAKSPLLGKTLEMRDLLRPFLDRQFHGSEEENRLAFLLAGAANPAVQAERFASRKVTEDRKSEELIRRLSALSGSSGGGTDRGPVDRITDDDREIARGMNIDLDDEKAAQKFLKYKQANAQRGGLALVSDGQLLGRR